MNVQRAIKLPVFYTVIFSFLLSFSGSLWAAPPHPKQVNEFMEVVLDHELTSAFRKNIEIRLNQWMVDVLTRLKSDERKKEIQIFFESDMLPYMLRENEWKKISPFFHKAISRSMTASEIQIVLDFYRTPAGVSYKKIMAKWVSEHIASFDSAKHAEEINIKKEMLRKEMSLEYFQEMERFFNSDVMRKINSNLVHTLTEILEKEYLPQIQEKILHFIEEKHPEWL